MLFNVRAQRQEPEFHQSKRVVLKQTPPLSLHFFSRADSYNYAKNSENCQRSTQYFVLV